MMLSLGWAQLGWAGLGWACLGWACRFLIKPSTATAHQKGHVRPRAQRDSVQFSPRVLIFMNLCATHIKMKAFVFSLWFYVLGT